MFILHQPYPIPLIYLAALPPKPWILTIPYVTWRKPPRFGSQKDCTICDKPILLLVFASVKEDKTTDKIVYS